MSFTRSRFIDSLRIYIKAGRGGNGYPKFGGIGGKGGDIYIEGVKNQTLAKTKKSKGKGVRNWAAEDGHPSKQFRILGKNGNDLIIPSPLGVSVKTDAGQELGSLLLPEDSVLVARGGAGGSIDNQYIGEKGERRHVNLLLKLIADIGLVGFPNAGKSTFLRAISQAKPKVASYPFTTLHPMIGTLSFSDLRQITLADLPGLIEGAWKNTGMGHKFLRHVERTKILLFVIDIEGFRLGPQYPFRPPIENILLLNRELELYDPELVEKQVILLLNKMDKPNSDKLYETITEQLANIKEVAQTLPEEMQPETLIEFSQVLTCSAKYDKESVENVKERLKNAIDMHDANSNNVPLAEFHELIKDKLYDKEIKIV